VIQAEQLKAQQLHDTLAIRQRFFAATNHDLQQPVHSLGIYLDLARTRLGQLAQPDSRLTEFLSDAKASYTGVAQFLDVLLDMARLDAGLLKPKPRNLPLEPLLERLGREYQLIAGRAGLELRRLPTDAVVFSDPHLLERIIRNLLANAVRYTQSGGVLIAVRSRQGQWRLDVFDTGPGLTPQDQEQLFSPFQSLSKSPREEQSGMGLGLYIVKALSQRLGHTVELKSQLGRGSRFSIGMQAADEGA
jgi:two-component system, sensor histidine kinase